MAVQSEYGYWPLVVALCLFMGIAAIAGAVLAALLVWRCAFAAGGWTAAPSRVAAGLVGTMAAGVTLSLAFSAGFWGMHTALAAVLDAAVLFVAVPASVALARCVHPEGQASHRDQQPPARPGTESEPLCTPMVPVGGDEGPRRRRGEPTPTGGGLFDAGSGDDAGLRHCASTAHVSSLVVPELKGPDSKTPEHGPAPHSAACDPPPLRPALLAKAAVVLRAVSSDVRRAPAPYCVTAAAALVLSAFAFLALHNSCVCSKPTTLTTWLSRRSAHGCPTDGRTPCHHYVMVGHGCDSLVAVAHIVVPAGTVPLRAYAEVCPAAAAADAAWCPAPVVHPGAVEALSPLVEDRRYVGHAPLRGLACGAELRVRMVFGHADGESAVAAPLCTRTLPNTTSAGAGSPGAAAPALSFVGGGDYVPGKPPGKLLLQHAVARRPNASFLFIGGDISYENNMRSCYRRYDEFFDEVTDAARVGPRKCLLPLLTGIGNHDAGGYEWAGAADLATAAGRSDAVPFYFRYFPTLSLSLGAQPGVEDTTHDHTLPHHAHMLGGAIGLVNVDSGHVLPCHEEAHYLRRALVHFRDVARVPAIVLYHVPAWPSVRDMDDSHVSDSRRAFVPVLEDFDATVAAVFENHDHSYKRTHRIRRAAAVDPTEAWRRLSGRGVLYTGDGALGAHKSDDTVVLERALLAKGFPGNYVLLADVSRDGVVSFTAVDTEGNAVDSFSAP